MTESGRIQGSQTTAWLNGTVQQNGQVNAQNGGPGDGGIGDKVKDALGWLGRQVLYSVPIIGPTLQTAEFARNAVSFGVNGANYLRDKLNGGAPETGGVPSIDDRVKLENGVLTINGTDAGENVSITKDGDKITVNYQVYDDNNVLLGEGTKTFDASEVSSVRVYGAGGNDVVENHGVDGAYISVGGGSGAGGDKNRVVNDANGVTIALGSYSGGGVVTNYGDDVTIQGTGGAADAIWTDGENVQVDAGGGDSVVNLGDGATIMIRGSANGTGADIVSVGDGVTIDAQNGTADTGVIVGRNGQLFFDPDLDKGTAATPEELGLGGLNHQQLIEALEGVTGREIDKPFDPRAWRP